MPRENLCYLDKRYREHNNMSMVENLKIIKEKGVTKFLAEQAEKWFLCITEMLFMQLSN